MRNSQRRILLVPFHQHLSSLYGGLVGRGCQVIGLVHHSHIEDRKLSKVSPVQMKLFVGYPLIFYHWFSIGFQAPRAIVGFSKKVKIVQPTAMIVFDFYHWYFLQALSVKRKNSSVKLIVYSETKRWPKRSFSSLILRFFLSYAKKHHDEIDHVFVYTKEGYDFLSKYIEPRKIKIMPAPVDTKVFTQLGSQQITSPRKELNILCNARFDPFKQHDVLLSAIKLLSEGGYECRLTLIGRAETGKDRVAKMVRDRSLEKYVTWLDTLPAEAMPGLYRSHDVLVLPSYNEAIGMVVPEAMACGIPTITSDTVGANVYVESDKTGLIFATGNVGALAAALKYYIDFPEKRMQHGRAAAAHIENNYSVEKIAGHFLKLLDSN